MAPLRSMGYGWKQVTAKLQQTDLELPRDRASLLSIERAGLFGLLDHWPPDISYFLD